MHIHTCVGLSSNLYDWTWIGPWAIIHNMWTGPLLTDYFKIISLACQRYALLPHNYWYTSTKSLVAKPVLESSTLHLQSIPDPLITLTVQMQLLPWVHSYCTNEPYEYSVHADRANEVNSRD